MHFRVNSGQFVGVCKLFTYVCILWLQYKYVCIEKKGLRFFEKAWLTRMPNLPWRRMSRHCSRNVVCLLARASMATKLSSIKSRGLIRATLPPNDGSDGFLGHLDLSRGFLGDILGAHSHAGMDFAFGHNFTIAGKCAEVWVLQPVKYSFVITFTREVERESSASSTWKR